jgi:hypothetical protein
MNEVRYCKDCEYYREPSKSNGYLDECKHLNSFMYFDTWKENSRVEIYPDEKNANNDCKDWRRK